LRKNNVKTKFLVILLFCCSAWSANHAVAQHFLGVSGGYSISSLQSSLYEDLRSTSSWVNYGVIYKYLSPKWVGIQTGVNYTERGFQRDSTMKRMYQIVEVPFVSQFHYELWKLRAIANAGVFASYAWSANEARLYPPEKAGPPENYTFQPTDNRFDYGLRFGAGLGVILRPVEIQFEFNYAIGLSNIHDPKKGSIYDIPYDYTIYHRFSQMVFSIGVLIAL